MSAGHFMSRIESPSRTEPSLKLHPGSTRQDGAPVSSSTNNSPEENNPWPAAAGGIHRSSIRTRTSGKSLPRPGQATTRSTTTAAAVHAGHERAVPAPPCSTTALPRNPSNPRRTSPTASPVSLARLPRPRSRADRSQQRRVRNFTLHPIGRKPETEGEKARRAARRDGWGDTRECVL